MYAIKTEGLRKLYGSHRGITDVNLAVEEGDFFGFIGPNGAGKSTTIRTLLGLISADGGRAEIFGRDIRSSHKDILSQIGYLPGEPTFYTGMKVRDILKLSADLYGKDCTEEAEKLCRRLELDQTRKVEQLSLGNRKKVGIVCALQHKPKLYIMDEPTSGLDPLIQHEFFSILQERSSEGATIFLSSHVLSEVQRYCRHAAVIRDGKTLVSDSVKELGNAGVKRVSLRGAHEIRLDGVKNISQTEDGISFLYSGSISLLLKALADLPVTDVNISEPDLEETFMHYYTKEDA